MPQAENQWVLTLVTIVAIAIIIYLLRRVEGVRDFKDFFAPIAAIIGISTLLGSFFEWRASRHEAAFRTFYERLDKANTSRNNIPQGEVGAVDPRTNYTFTELDNLEITIELYRMGYITHRHALRATRTFELRLKQLSWFAGRVSHFASGKDGLSAIGYSPTMSKVVNKMLCTEVHQLTGR